VLVDVDFSRHIFNEIMFESEGYAFKVAIKYEWMPDFCSHCQIIGYDVTACCLIMSKQAFEKVDCGKKLATTLKRTFKKNWKRRTQMVSNPRKHFQLQH